MGPPDTGIRVYYSGNFRDYKTRLQAAAKNLTPEKMAAVDKRVAEWKPDLSPLIKLADSGEIRSQLNLGLFYAQGKNIEKNYQEAHFWLTLALQGDRRYHPFVFNPNIGYPKWRKEAAKHLTPEQKAAVDKRLAEWKPVGGKTSP